MRIRDFRHSAMAKPSRRRQS